MGLSSSKTKTTTDQTVKPVAPAYLTDTAKAFSGAVSTALARDPSSRVLPANEAQMKAFADAGNLGGWKGGLDSASSAATKAGNAGASSTTAQSLLTNLDSYQNPFQQQVIDTSLADFDANSGVTRAAQAADGARNGALGGSRFGVREALTEGELARGRGSLDANLRAEGFNTATRLSGEDAGRRQQVGMFNADMSEQQKQRALDAARVRAEMANAQSANSRADLELQARLAEQQRQIQMQQANADITSLGAIGQVQGMTPYEILVGQNMTGTSTTKTKGAPMDYLMQLASSAASAFGAGS